MVKNLTFQKLARLLLYIAVPNSIGFLSGLLGTGSMQWYGLLAKPVIKPPENVFPIIWPALYTLMGIALFFAVRADSSNTAMWWFGLQLVLNGLWTPVFFGLQSPVMALIILIALIAVVLRVTVLFYELDKRAGYLFLPYGIWLLVALYLNAGIALLN